MTKKGWVKEYGYVAEENKTYFYLKHCYQDLNDEVEIIEEEKKIPEKIKDKYNSQISKVELAQKYNEIIAVDIDTIERNGGGSARCMLAEIFLNRK